ncbi:ABC transporter permease subunit [Cellulomonas sp. KRMCY2]|uniref:ABC transporter permease subunit n=1 Tax=Cellulomonas sp. KRMCY2 TaxID=1304865 RepID=UPI0004BC1BC7|nr:ABC transporter permease subunit [Cellulomonas sp. KRMCY2]
MTARIGTVLTGVLRTQRRSLALWAVAIAAVSAMYSAFYPAIGQVKFEAMMESMPPELVTAMGFESMSTAAGYISATVYSLLGAVLVLVCSIGLGARLVAGNEEDGLLELELSAPVSRRRVYLERLAALWVTVLVLVLAVTAILLLLSVTMDLGLVAGNLVAAGAGLLLFGGALGTLALAVGAVTGRRGFALGTASAVAVLAYLFGYIGPLVEADWMEAVSPYHWDVGTEPLINGVDWPGLGLLLALALVPAVAGLLRFDRRDVMV